MQSGTITRRSFLASGSLAALALYSGKVPGQNAEESVTVQTPAGALRGMRREGVKIFRGVPFAEAPTGALRFRAPVKKKRWTQTRDASRFARAAMQPYMEDAARSEDCLYLNIWAPEGKGPFPVFVWIHGGGFSSGMAAAPMFDGTEFARAGIVCVTVAYRLGIFGFADLEPLLGRTYAGTGNNGLRDLMAGLEWVQENIAALGGDPSRVTVGGESAGAKLTDILMGVPVAEPLFHQMISESGGAERVLLHANAIAVGQGFGAEWSGSGAHAMSELLTADAGALIEAQERFLKKWPQHFPLRPEIDGSLMTKLPIEQITEGSTRHKRLLIGTNRDESAAFIGAHPAKDASMANLGNISVERFHAVYERYKEIYPEMTVEQLRIRALTAEEYWIPTMRVADAHVGAGGSAWMYRLDFVESNGGLPGYAYHSLDTGMVWDKPHMGLNNSDAEAALAKQMHAAWAAFIRGEAPAAVGLPPWPKYRSDLRPTMILDIKSRIEERPQESELRLWDDVL